MEQLLLAFVDTLDASLKKMQRELGEGSSMSKLTIHQFQYIDAIYELGEPTITEIADRLNITKASVTAGVKKLIQMGYVIKTQSLVDRRVFHVSLTQASEQLIQVKFRTVKEYGDFIRSALNEEEISQFSAILIKLIKLFEHADLMRPDRTI